MSVKLICLLAIFTLCATVVITEARGGGRGRGGSLGSTFYRRSHKKHGSSGNGGSRRKIISSSPVHTSYTNSMFAAEGVDEHFAKHRSRHRSKHHKSTSTHKSPTHTDSHVNHNSHSTSGKQGRHNTHNSHSLGSGVSHHHTNAASPHISHNWGGHQLPPGHVYVTQPSSIPVNAVYYAQPPRHTNTDDSTAFDLGYLVGRSITRRRQHHHHNYEQQPQQQPNNQTQTAITTVANHRSPTVVAHPTEQPHYWPTDSEIALAPLNNTLIPNGVTTSEPIFKNPPILSAQKLTADNATFELATVTAPPPATPPTNGIICMPWNFNETDPAKPENVIVVQKTICFPAPPAPPAPPTTSMGPIAGDISVDVSTTTKAALT